jgi:hypothetical protein
MSYAAIAAALALPDLSVGERLAAYSLASYANQHRQAWPGTRVAAARAGLSKTQYLATREGLAKRGLIAIEESGGGRGRSALIDVRFAHTGPWVEADVNAPLFEAVVSYSSTRGAPRLLLATAAAVADDQRHVDGMSTEEICAAAGISDRTYRRACVQLLGSGELILISGGGGRGCTNRWVLREPRSGGARPRTAMSSRVAARPGTMPLIGVAEAGAEQAAQPHPVTTQPAAAAHEREREKPSVTSAGVSVNTGQTRTVSSTRGATLAFGRAVNPGQDRTVCPETRQKPRQPNARAGREPQNPGTVNPPSPPEGGRTAGEVFVDESYVTDRGRRRTRRVAVDADAIRRKLSAPSPADEEAWRELRRLMREAAGQSTFGIWLSDLELVAVDVEGLLVLTGPQDTLAWLNKRFDRLFSRCCAQAGRHLRFASPPEQLVICREPHRASAPVSEQPTINRRVS